MNINYIVLVHKNPYQIRSIITKLNHKDTWFYVHVDQKTNIAPFQALLQEIPNVTLIPDELREICNWGGIGVVKACLAIFRMIIDNGREGYAVLLSGQDYPIKSNTYIAEYFKKHSGTDFITCFSLPSSNWSFEGMNRLSHYKIDLSNKRGDFIQLPSIWSKEFYNFQSFKKLLKLTLSKKGRYLSKLLRKKKFPSYIKPYGGDTWWALSTNTIDKILQFLEIHPDLLNFMAFSNLPDEMIFQSIVIELYGEDYKNIKNSVTYSNWSGLDKSSPEIFTPEGLGKIKSISPDILFARKFDLEKHPNIYELVENTTSELKE
ncbi:beta-1,6-N-acetylglucosaminyltransferase [uncultured Cyclobacterium sp.]|uniref:beta-1,6-N-acetylglucosaminyltransferase n=1 Tax=uncultured Cyclobacterium sp. TaxID=453820 RepID=UPI0030ED1F34|tara:strand:+ start:141178 stop:142134 length:957 start_codon:yes stop_codon:yes gene_type:complete